MVNRAKAIELGGPSFVPGFDRDKVSQDGRNKQHLFSWGSNLHLAWNLGDYTFTSITGLEHATTYSLGDVDVGYGASRSEARRVGKDCVSTRSSRERPQQYYEQQNKYSNNKSKHPNLKTTT